MFMNEAMLVQTWLGVLMFSWGAIVARHDKRLAKHNLQNHSLAFPTSEANEKGKASANISE